MKPISLQHALQWIPHATLCAPQHVALGKTSGYGVNTDTRTLRSGNLFIALKGERFDAHRFISFAAQHGAAAAVVDYDSVELALQDAGTMPLIKVPHTGKALQQLAAAYRQQFQIPLALLVGSNGKTTAKEMIHCIFKAHVGAAGNERASHCTVGNFNNDIGLPLTLLRLNDDHRYSVVELGMNHPGETAQLAAIAAPTVALINNAQREHQEFMQTVQAVAQEHADVIDALPANGTAVLPAQDAYIALWRARAGQKTVLDFALHSASDTTPAAVTGTRTEHGLHQTLTVQTPLGSASITLRTAGEHNARNALAAIAVAIAAGVPLGNIVAGLEAFEPVKGRMQQHHGIYQGIMLTVIDDSYNANPDSVEAATQVLHALAGRTVLVLGDMGEVGDQGEAFHREAGQQAAAQGVDALYTVGALCAFAHTAFKASGKPCQHFADVTALNNFLLGDDESPAKALQALDTVLIKGSRFMRMETVVDAVLGKQSNAAGGH